MGLATEYLLHEGLDVIIIDRFHYIEHFNWYFSTIKKFNDDMKVQSKPDGTEGSDANTSKEGSEGSGSKDNGSEELQSKCGSQLSSGSSAS